VIYLIFPQDHALISGHVPGIIFIGFHGITIWWFQHFNPNGLSPVVYFALQVQKNMNLVEKMMKIIREE
jgi:hypothetical protein